MLKVFVIDLADFFAWMCKRRAAAWLRRSRWWADVSESIDSGVPLDEVKKQNGGAHD